jgi:hypothetical protein
MRILKYWLLCGAALIAANFTVAAPQPAQAQFGFGFRGLPVHIHIGPTWRRHGGRHRKPRGGEKEERDDGAPSARSTEKSEKILASLGAPSSAEQSRVLKGISASAVLGVVGSTKDLQDVGKPQSKEDDRDYTGALDRVVLRLSRSQDKALATAGDASASGIEQALIRAIKDTNLDQFERFASESWTTDRIRKLVLDRVFNNLDPLLKGQTRGQVRMQDIEPVIQSAAAAIYRRIFETSELLATNRAANQFIQNLYQKTGGRVDERTREIADSLVRRGSTTMLARYEDLLSSDLDNSYAYHYRAHRIVYDCLSKHMGEVAKTEQLPASAEAIDLNIRRLVDKGKACDLWLTNQFGAPVPGTKIKSQSPVPLRAVWAEGGPETDSSMFSRSQNRL